MARRWQHELPEAQGSKVVREQQKELYRATVQGLRAAGELMYELRVLARWDDHCGNGSNSFYCYYQVVMSGTNRESERISWDDPRLAADVALVPAHLIALGKWNGCHSFGPWYYIENTLHHAGDKDCYGLRKGEVRQIKNGRTGLPVWRTVAIDKDGEEFPLHDKRITAYVDAAEQPPCPYRIEYRPWCRIGEGKERQLDCARSAAIWSNATDAQLMDENLATALQQRLPGVLLELRATVESLGFVW